MTTPEKSDDLIEIRKYYDPNLADFHLSLLQKEGIPACLKDEFLNLVQPFWKVATGGIKLLVRSEDAEHALGVLNQELDLIDADENETQTEQPYAFYPLPIFSRAPTRTPIQCPQCRSKKIDIASRFTPTFIALYVALFGALLWVFGFVFAMYLSLLLYLVGVLVLPRAKPKCRNCGWTPAPIEPAADDEENHE